MPNRRWILLSATIVALWATMARADPTPVAFPWVLKEGWQQRPETIRTGIVVQNVDDTTGAMIEGRFYGRGVTLPRRYVGIADAGQAYYFYLPGMNLADGAYSALFRADIEIAAVARTEWLATSGVAEYNHVVPDSNVRLPLVAKRFHDQCSTVHIQNTDAESDQASIVVVEIVQSGNLHAAYTNEYDVQPGRSVTLDLCHDPAFDDRLQDGFLGSAIISAQDGSTRFGVQSFVEVASTGAVYAFDGVPTSHASAVQFAPLFRASQKLGRRHGDTGVSVANIDSRPADVTITYFPLGGDCEKKPVAQSRRIDANASYVFWQGPVADNPLKGSNCYGTARIDAGPDGKILAVVNDGSNDYAAGTYNLGAAAYNTFREEDTGTEVAIPLFRTGHTSDDLWTGIACMNVGPEPALLTLTAKNLVTGDELVDIMRMEADPNGLAAFWPVPVHATGHPWNDQRMAVGSAIVRADQPIACIVADIPQGTAVSLPDLASYNGVVVRRQPQD